MSTRQIVPALLPDMRERAEKRKEKEKCARQEQMQLTAIWRAETSGWYVDTAALWVDGATVAPRL